MSQQFEAISERSATEQDVAIRMGPPLGPCGCIGCRAPEVEYYDDDGELVDDPISLEELPPEWLAHMRDEQCLDDDEIVEHVNEWYCRGDFPTRCLDLHGAVIINGVPGFTRRAATVWGVATPWIEEHLDRFEPGGGDGAALLAQAMNWCRANCQGLWIISSEEHVSDLYYVYLTFRDEADAVKFDEEMAR